MARTGTDMARTVHPALAGAVLRELAERPGPGRAAVEAARLLAAGEPVSERLHRELLGDLYALGAPAMAAAARRLVDRPADPTLAGLLASTGLAELVAGSQLIGLWFHVGHTTSVRYRRNVMTVRHVPYLGSVPVLAETLFVCFLYQAGAALVTGRTPEVSLLAEGGAVLPPSAAWRRPPPRVLGWRLDWRPGEIPPQGPAGQPVTAVRRLLAPEPARAWRVASAAAELGVAPRSLQRALTRAGTTFQAELLMVRLDVAAQLIRRTGLPLAEIAATAGFTDHPHLTRRFRERYGCTPSAYRTAPGG